MTWLAELVAALSMLVVSATAPAVRQPLPTTTAPADSRCGEWYGLALEVGWSPDDWRTLDRIMFCESKCQPDAHNPSGATGLLQVMPMWHDGRDAYDPRTNLTIGLEVLNAQGWRAWSCYGN